MRLNVAGLVVLLAAMLSGRAEAQTDGIRYYPPGGSGGDINLSIVLRKGN